MDYLKKNSRLPFMESLQIWWRGGGQSPKNTHVEFLDYPNVELVGIWFFDRTVINYRVNSKQWRYIADHGN